MMRRRTVPILALVLLLALPSAAFACPACMDLTSSNRIAFLQTAIALTLLPFGLVGGLGYWLRRKFRDGDAVDDEVASSSEDSPEGPGL